MADFGLSKALSAAVAEGASKAKVLRPAEAEIAAKEKLRAGVPGAAAEPQLENIGTPTEETPSAVADAAGTPVDQSSEAPQASPVTVPDETPAAIEPTSEVLDDSAGVPKTPPSEETATIPPVDPVVDDTNVDADAQRLSKATLGDYALDATHQPNFDTMTMTDDVKGVIADLADKNAGKIDEARRGTITHDQLQGLANDLDVSTDVVHKIIARESGGTVNAETVLAARQVLAASADRLKGLAQKIATGTATNMERVQFARQQQFHNEYFNQFMGARAEAGRALNAFGIPTGSDTVIAGRINEILQASGIDIDRTARAIHMANDVSGVTKIARGSLLRRTGQGAVNLINRVFVNGILSGPPTHLVNMAGNAIFQAMNIGEMAMAARLGRFLSGDEHVIVGEALATLQGTLGATKDGFRLFGRALKTGQTLDGTLKYEAAGGKTPTLSSLPELDKPYLGAIISALDQVIDLPTRFLGAEDELFKTLAYRGDLQRQALLHVQDQMNAGTLTIENAAQSARDFMENAPSGAQQAAEDWAHEVSFQNPLGPAGQKLTQFLRTVPILTLIAPFVRTPGNIFKAAAARSPMAAFSAKFWDAMSKGGRARDLALTRFAVGTGTSAMVAMWVAGGDMTGGGPQDPKARMLWMEDGKRPYSIKVSDPVTGNVTWHSYARLEPFASVLGATADATEIYSYISSDVDTLQDDQSRTYQAAGAIIAGIMNNTGNKTFMKGISDFVELMNDPGRSIQNYSQMMAASLMPYSGASRFVRNTQDPYLREAWTLIDKIQDNTPGYSTGLPLRLDLFGQPREKNSSSLLGTMSPIPESPQNYDSVVKGLTDVMNQTHQVPVTMPDKRIEGMRLNADEYSDLVRLSRAEPVFGGGLNFHDKLDQVMTSSVYQKAQPLYQAQLLQQTQTAADTIGRGKLEKDNPDFRDRITAWRLQKNRLLYDK